MTVYEKLQLLFNNVSFYRVKCRQWCWILWKPPGNFLSNWVSHWQNREYKTKAFYSNRKML